MLEIIKYGSNKYGVWVVGHLKYEGLDFLDIFNTNLKDEDVLKDKTNVKVKMVKITRAKNGTIHFALEF